MNRKVKVRNRKLKGKARRGTTAVTEVEKASRSPFMGSRLTVSNRRSYLKTQEETFIKNQVKFYEERKAEILAQEGTEEEKQTELTQLESKKLSESALEARAKAFATFQANKESKHYKAYLEGRLFYKYKGQMWPVVTEESLMHSQKLINIQQEESNEDDTINTREDSESAALIAVSSSD